MSYLYHLWDLKTGPNLENCPDGFRDFPWGEGLHQRGELIVVVEAMPLPRLALGLRV